MDSQDFTLMGMQILNWQDVYNKKCGNTWLYTNIIVSEEDKDIVENETKELQIFCKNCDSLRFFFKDELYDIQLKKIWSSDLKSLSCISSDYSCIFCHYLKKYNSKPFWSFPDRDISNILGLSSEAIYPCHLHGFERMCECLLYDVTRGQRNAQERMLRAFSKHPHLKHLNFQSLDFHSDKENDNVFERLSMLTGNAIIPHSPYALAMQDSNSLVNTQAFFLANTDNLGQLTQSSQFLSPFPPTTHKNVG